MTEVATAASVATSRWRLPLAALGMLAAGASNVLAFAPFGWWPLQILSLALLFGFCLRVARLRQALLFGWLYGFGWSAAGVHWLYISLHDFGAMPAPMAVLAVLLLAAYVGLFSAAAIGATLWLQRRWQTAPAAAALLLAPACWALGEWLRGWLLTGFPWLASGYAHDASPLAGYAPLLGVYGVALLAAIVAAAIGLGWSQRLRRAPLMLAVLLLVCGAGLHQVNWTSAAGRPLTVRLLQGAIPQQMKFDRTQLQATLALYQRMIEAAPADLIVTPETALPVFPQQLPSGYLAGLQAFAQQSGSHLLLGAPLGDAPGHYTNSAFGIAPDAQPQVPPYRYDKHHLVPFGEFVPFGFHWFVAMMQIPLGDFSRGALVQAPFAVNDQWVLPNICYEDLFGEEIAAQLRPDSPQTPRATLLLNMSNIAWFGDTIALPQHLQISRMRALETGRPMLRATNTGVTAVIDAKGRVSAHLAPGARGSLDVSVQGYRGSTPYLLFGNKGMLALAGLMLALAGWSGRRGRRQRGPAAVSAAQLPKPR